MAQSSFIYQARVDPSWYIAPFPVQDLSWMQTHASTIVPKPPVVSYSVDASRFMELPSADAPLLTQQSRVKLIVVVPSSQKVEPLGYLALPVDLSWNVPATQWAPRRVEVPENLTPVGWFLPFLADPVDLSWVQSRGVPGSRPPPVLSQKADIEYFVPPPVPPDLSWLQTRASTIVPKPPVVSSRGDPTGRLELPVDLSWNVPRTQWSPRRVEVRSYAIGIAGYLALPVDLAWIRNYTEPPPRHPVLRSTHANVATFIPPSLVPDLSWMLGGAPFMHRAQVGSHTIAPPPSTFVPPLSGRSFINFVGYTRNAGIT